VNAEQIFEEQLLLFNPEDIHQDCQEFLQYLLDLLHEELKLVYVSNAKEPGNSADESKSSKTKKQDFQDEWKGVGEKNETINFNQN
jgi:ubiquitin C-terminal hydrolase